MGKASDKQVAGNHYKQYAIQPAEFIQKNRLNWCEGNAIKYLLRHADKKGAEDLLKAKHYIDLLLEWEYSTPLPAGEGSATVKDATAESLCLTCGRDPGCVGDYPRTKGGGCEGYSKAEAGVHISEWWADESKKAERKASLCHSCHADVCATHMITKCEETGTCPDFMSGPATSAKQEPPTAADLPLDFTLPSITLKCTAEEAWRKFESEVEEWRATETESAEQLIERWDCLQAIQTFYERGGNVKRYQDRVQGIMHDLAWWRSVDKDVMEAKAAMLCKNAIRGYYTPEVNAVIIASSGRCFTPEGA